MDSELYGLLKIRYLSTDCITIIFPAMLAQFKHNLMTIKLRELIQNTILYTFHFSQHKASFFINKNELKGHLRIIKTSAE